MLRKLQAGSVDALREPNANPPGMLIGSVLAEENGIPLNSQVEVTVPNAQLTPIGPRPVTRRFRVVGIFSTGFYEIDKLITFENVEAVQRAYGAFLRGDVEEAFANLDPDIVFKPTHEAPVQGLGSS